MKFAVVAIVAGFLCANASEAASQRVNIKLSGQYCLFYLVDLEKALKKVPGVKGLDFETMKNHVIVTIVPGKVDPKSLVSAVRSIKGTGYRCNGRFDGEPGPVQNY
jgi:copper chaperone CopZ